MIDVLRPGRRAEVVAGTATACRAATSRCSIDLYLQGRLDLDRFVSETIAPRRGRGGVPQDGAGRGPALGGRALTDAADGLRSTGSSPTATFSPRRRGLRRRQQHLAGRRRRRGAWSSTPPTTPRRSSTRVGGRRVVAIVCTHGHNDHINAAAALADGDRRADLAPPRRPDAVGRGLPGPAPDAALGRRPDVRRSPASSSGAAHARATRPGGCCLHGTPGGALFSGDTLFNGGPGATGRSFSDFADHHRVDPRPGCSRCRRTPSCTPATATTPRSATRPRTSTSGSPGATRCHPPHTPRQ